MNSQLNVITSIPMEIAHSSLLKLTSPGTMKAQQMIRFTSNQVILIFILINQLTILSHCSHITTMISTIVASPAQNSQRPPNANSQNDNIHNHSVDGIVFNKLAMPVVDGAVLIATTNSIRRSRIPMLDRNNTESSLVSEATDTTITKPISSFLGEAESSTGSISDLVDDNYLAAATNSDDRDVSSSPYEITVTKVDDISASDISHLLGAKAQYAALKSKRQAHSFAEASDWWTKLASKSSIAGKTSKSSNTKNSLPSPGKSQYPTKVEAPPNSAKKTGSKNELAFNNRPSIYKEQPLNQNVILTIRNQLTAIRGKHKVLVTRSVRQLQQLDTKLIDSYKLCLKKKMPLYAGMLYRTRDFVVKMAKEVKQERQVLEAMTKQVQNVLRQKVTNKTLVKEYNRLVATSTESSFVDDVQRVTPVKIVATKSITSSRTKKETSSQSEDSAQQTDNSVTEQSTNPTFVPQDISMTTTAKKNWFGGRQKGTSNQSNKSFSNSTTNSILTATKSKHTNSEKMDSTTKSAKRLKPRIKYTVSVNEVNLKKELNKIQALIDRINGSSYELSTVVDDINHLFKLGNSDFSYKKGSSLTGKMIKIDKMYYSQSMDESGAQTELKRMRKMFRSPARIFFEKYGKFPEPHPDTVTLNHVNNSTNLTNNSDTNLPEMKPLFDASSMIYTEPTDHELGFDLTSNGQ